MKALICNHPFKAPSCLLPKNSLHLHTAAVHTPDQINGVVALKPFTNWARMAAAIAHGSLVRLLPGNPAPIRTFPEKSITRVLRLEFGGSGRPLSRSVKPQRRVWGERRGSRCRETATAVCALGDRIEDSLPTQADIIASAKEKGMLLAIKPTGPLFVVTAVDVATGDNLGTADGFIKPWIDANILHLDSIRLTKASATRSGRTIFGAAVYMGALMVRHGIDCACNKGELLAINDSDEYHKKLVRYYCRLGWEAVHEVTGDSWRDFLHMLVWGGVGTRMDADLRELLGKWAATLKPASKAKAMVES